MQRLMKLLRVRGMPPDIEVCVTVGMCYLTYYVSNAPLHLSGVIAVVVFGLYGSATLKWDMSAVSSQNHFPRFWDVLSQVSLPPVTCEVLSWPKTCVHILFPMTTADCLYLAVHFVHHATTLPFCLKTSYGFDSRGFKRNSYETGFRL